MKLGYIGLGNIGGALARRLLRERPWLVRLLEKNAGLAIAAKS